MLNTLKNKKTRAGKKAQWSKGLAALSEDLGLIPSMHVTVYKSSSRVSVGARHHTVQTTCRENTMYIN